MALLPPQKLKEQLVAEELISEEQFDDIVTEADRMNQTVGDLLVSKGVISQDYLYTMLADSLGVERANLNEQGIDPTILHLVDEKFAREKGAVVFAKEKNGTLDVAMQDPSDLLTVEFLEKRLRAKLRIFLATNEDLARAFVMYGKQLVEDFKKIIEEKVRASLALTADSKNEEEAAAQLPIVEIVNNLLSYAASLRASDIHWEVLDNEILVRFRVDGILYEMMRVPKQVHAPVIARTKLLAALKVDEHQKPQDGRFRFRTGQQIIDVRVSIIPTLYGEKIVMRLLPATQRPLSLGEVGMLERTAKLVEANMKKTYGMILSTGPTGSGKTTTLYAVLNMLNHPQVNIVTIEDPIEYNIKYINQIQINPVAGITFASGLRSILRQDPNIIMVGEIRDEETADIAINAALTGHLLLSTLHTNDAPSAVPRLIDMNIPPFLVSAVLNLVLAQRLVRKICLDCIESYKAPQEVKDSIKQELKDLGIEENKTSIPDSLYKGKGCKVCNFTGYQGRIAIFEALEVSDNIRKIIVEENFSLGKLISTARKEGMITMFEDGLEKVTLGMTTIEEVLRVIRE